MNKPITADEMCEFILKTLDEVVEDFPEEEKGEAKVKILEAFGMMMSRMPMGEQS